MYLPIDLRKMRMNRNTDRENFICLKKKPVKKYKYCIVGLISWLDINFEFQEICELKGGTLSMKSKLKFIDVLCSQNIIAFFADGLLESGKKS